MVEEALKNITLGGKRKARNKLLTQRPQVMSSAGRERDASGTRRLKPIDMK